MSSDGSVVVGIAWNADYDGKPFRWTWHGGMEGLGSLPDPDAYNDAFGVSPSGSVVVGVAGSPSEAFRWTPGEGMVGLGDPDWEDFESRAYDVSEDGSIIVGFGTNSNGYNEFTEAFRWTADEGMIGLGDLPGGRFESWAYGVSADGSIVVGFGTNADGNSEAFRWTAEEGMVGLGDLGDGSFGSVARSISADGSTIVGQSYTPPDDGFRWTAEEGSVPLDRPGALPLDVSGDGSVVVGARWESPSDEYQAFIWDAVSGGQYLEDVLIEAYGLDLSWRTLIFAAEVSDDGLTMVGAGANASDNTEAWIVVLPDCNHNGRADHIDLADGTGHDENGNFILDECEANIAIVDSDPPDCAIDARQPSEPDGSDPAAWASVDLTFDGDASGLTNHAFTISPPLRIRRVMPDGNTVTVEFDPPIPRGRCIKITHILSDTSTSLCSLPADVDGDCTSSPIDILEMIDVLNGVVVRPIWSTDIDRSGQVNPLDVLRVIDLLSGADVYDRWNGTSPNVPPGCDCCPN